MDAAAPLPVDGCQEVRRGLEGRGFRAERWLNSEEPCVGRLPCLFRAVGVSSIAVDPVQPRLLYASMYWGAVFRSTDGGVHWQQAPLGLKGGADARQIVIDPFDKRTVWLGLWGRSGVWVSRDSGRTWKHTWDDELHEVQTIGPDPRHRGWVYAGLFGPGLFLTKNSRAAWRPLRAPLPNREVETLLVARTGGLLYVGTNSGAYIVTMR
jgi:hypothetical protein